VGGKAQSEMGKPGGSSVGEEIGLKKEKKGRGVREAPSKV